MPCTRHRVFLATLIVTAKYLNDSSPKNCHWTNYAVMFDIEEINLMEKQLLYLLDYDLRFSEADACRMFAPFMSSDARQAQDASTRASAVNRVAKAGRARAQAKARQIQLPATPPEDLPAPSSSSSTPLSTEAAKLRLSPPDLSARSSQGAAIPPVMYPALSTDSLSSSSSSEMGSLVDDTGSSSSSSGWLSSEDEGSEDENSAQVYQSQSQPSGVSFEPIQRVGSDEPAAIAPVKKPFIHRAMPSYTYRSQHLTQARDRMPSDTSSVHTVTASSPRPTPSAPSFLTARTTRLHRESKRSSSGSFLPGSASQNDGIRGSWRDISLPSSTTLPSLPRSGVSGSFLSRMWGAATKAQDKDRGGPPSADISDPSAEVTGVHQRHSTLRRLVLVHSRAGNGARGAQTFEV